MEKKELVGKYLVMGNWTFGHPSGRIAKDVVVCDDWQQAQRIMNGMEKDHTTYITHKYIRTEKDVPYFSPSKYEVTYRNANECTLWLKG